MMPAAEGDEEGNISDQEEDEFEMLLAGYRACAAETLRFLLEEEHLPPDSPLLTGLWQHLLRQQLRLVVDRRTSNDSGISGEMLDTSESVFSPEEINNSSPTALVPNNTGIAQGSTHFWRPGSLNSPRSVQSNTSSPDEAELDSTSRSDSLITQQFYSSSFVEINSPQSVFNGQQVTVDGSGSAS